MRYTNPQERHISEPTLVNDLLRIAKRRNGLTRKGDAELHPRSAHRIGNLSTLRDRERQNLLREEVLAGVCGLHHHVAVHVRWGGDHHRIHIVTGEQPIQFPLERDFELLCPFRSTFCDLVPNCHHARLVLLVHGARVLGGVHVPTTQHSNADHVSPPPTLMCTSLPT